MLVAVGAVPVALQDVLHAVPPALHEKFEGQAEPVPGVQPPALLQVPAPAGVNVEPVQVAAPHVVELVGYVHAPPLVQAVAPHVPPVTHAVVQQLPVPETPHAPLVHALFFVHAPVASLGTQSPDESQ